MDTKAKSQFRLLFPCYFSFFVNGAMVLLVGAILPYIIEEAGINYIGGLTKLARRLPIANADKKPPATL